MFSRGFADSLADTGQSPGDLEVADQPLRRGLAGRFGQREQIIRTIYIKFQARRANDPRTYPTQLSGLLVARQAAGPKPERQRQWRAGQERVGAAIALEPGDLSFKPRDPFSLSVKINGEPDGRITLVLDLGSAVRLRAARGGDSRAPSTARRIEARLRQCAAQTTC